MHRQQLIKMIRDAKLSGHSQMVGTLKTKFRGVNHICLTNLDGALNGNPHDVWVKSRGAKNLGRIYLGSKNQPANTDGWEALIDELLTANA